jgi:hypothetical protein
VSHVEARDTVPAFVGLTEMANKDINTYCINANCHQQLKINILGAV